MNVTQELKHVNVAIEHGSLGSVMDWCRENCHAGWRIENNLASSYKQNRFTGFYNHFVFVFEDSADQMAFVLKWL